MPLQSALPVHNVYASLAHSPRIVVPYLQSFCAHPALHQPCSTPTAAARHAGPPHDSIRESISALSHARMPDLIFSVHSAAQTQPGQPQSHLATSFQARMQRCGPSRCTGMALMASARQVQKVAETFPDISLLPTMDDCRRQVLAEVLDFLPRQFRHHGLCTSCDVRSQGDCSDIFVFSVLALQLLGLLHTSLS